MNRSVRLTCSLLIAATVLALSLPAVAQDSSPAASDQSSVANAKNAHELTLAEIEDALATLEANTEIEDSVKVMLRLKYQQAIETLKAAVSNSDKSAEYREAIKQAPAATAELRRQLVELPSASSFDDVPKFDSFDDFQQELNGKRSERTELEEQLSSVTAELNDGQQRPEEISVRIPEAEQELSEVRQQLAAEEDSQDEASVSRVADRFLLEAQKARLVSELELLNQEMLSMTVRRILQQTRKELLTRQLENASAAVAAYEASLDKSVMTQAQEITARVAELKERLPADGLANELVMEVEELAGELTDVLQDKAAVAAATAAETARLQRLEQRYGGISRQLELRQSDRAMAEVLLKLRELLIRQGREPVQEPQWPTLSQARLAAVLVDSAIDDQKAVQELFADQSSDAVNKLVATRIEVLGKLRDQYLELLLALTTLESEKTLYSAKAADVDAEITRHLFWMQVSPPLQMQDLIATPNGLRWVFNPMHGTEFVQSMWEEMRRAPYASAAVVFVVAALLLMRPWLRTALKRAGEGVGRVSRDRYRLTVKAILWTVLLALPVPLVVGFIAATLPLPDTLLDWLRGVRGGLRLQAGNIFMACFVAACCCPDGLGQQHYKWRTEYLYWIRRSCRWYLIVYVPFFMLTFCAAFSESASFLDGAGRVSFIVAHTWLAIFLWRLLHSPHGIRGTNIRKKSAGLMLNLVTVLAVICPAGLLILAGGGYMIAALQVSNLFVLTLSIIAGIAILFGLTLRWFRIEHRRLAFAEAVERRRSRQEAAVAGERQTESDNVIVVDEDEQELDIDAIDDQTQHLVRLLFGLGMVAAVLSLWSETIPVLDYFASIGIPMTTDLTLLDLTKASLIVAVTWVAASNSPGVLEFAILRSTSIHAGTRNAIATIVQYVIVAAGFFLSFNALRMDWTQFGWIAGGLSVGIGFGLQEVVANFVCGLILLFERPVRVGDVVTVEGDMGTVTKIHLRATTIINFDRGEVVLPNKTLITSKLVNWTLSSPLNRNTISVGVAYGSDTEKARQILLEVAADHPGVSDEPAPIAIFDEFADSALNITLRVFLPDRNNRETTLSELHTEINQRFAAAGIEIPFPQRDLNLRSGWPPAS